MKMVYFTLGEINDTAGTGITLASYIQDENGEWISILRTEDGEPFFGYKPKEISKEEYEIWADRIKNPDLIEYFPGKFPGIGVVDKKVHDKLVKDHELLIEIEKNRILSTKEALAKKLGMSVEDLMQLAAFIK